MVRSADAASDLGVHCLPMPHKKDARLIRANKLSPQLKCLLKVKVELS